MLGKLTTRIALHKAGLGGLSSSIPSNPFDSPPPKSNNKKSKDGKNPESVFEQDTNWTSTFANLTVPKALVSWQTPPAAPVEIGPAPVVGERAPDCAGEGLGMPFAGAGAGARGRKCLVVFLRCCGCPFAEQTFLNLRTLANAHPSLIFLAISHCTESSTQRWLTQIGGAWNVQVISDPSRTIYAKWGLGISNSWHVLNPWTQVAQRKLGNEKGVWAREVGEGGNRWVIGGAWAVDDSGFVRWGGAMATADDGAFGGAGELGEGIRVLMSG